MNSPKKTIGVTLRVAALGVALLASSMAGAQDASSQLNFVRSLKAAYAAQSSSSGTAAARAELNSGAQSSPDCQALMTAKQNAASNHVRNKLPPDPTTVIQNTTCFLDVMEIQIPTTGIGFLDAVVGAVTPFLQSTACDSMTSWWGDMQSKMSSGNFQTLMNQSFGGNGGTFTPTPIPSNPFNPNTGGGGTGGGGAGGGGMGGGGAGGGGGGGGGFNPDVNQNSYWQGIQELRRRLGLEPAAVQP